MIKKILVPLDGSKLAEKALSYAEELAWKFKAELILVRVSETAPVTADHGVPIRIQPNDSSQNEAKLYLNGIKGELRELQVPAQVVVRESPAVAEAIIELVCQKAVDLIVMSTHGRSGLSRWIYGSVAHKVLQGAPCPIYLIRAQEADS